VVKRFKSKWDFGELFPPEQIRKILSVSELTTRVRQLLETQVGSVWVSGEVSNLRAQSSGHVYFTLKDAAAQLGCVLFRGETVAHRELLKDGQKVLLQGDVTVYEARGQYQLIVRAVELQGVGALQIAFEKLKQKLQAEGWFSQERKRPLPRYPERIGLVTSPTGAAIRDVLHVVRRRNPGLQIVLAPCRVQGEGAAMEIAEAIRLLNRFAASVKSPEASPVGPSADSSAQRISDSTHLDLILVTRGGGSLEDLWAFNEETVARAIFESQVPVVSAIGHEIDFTISDFVADVRAATPSAAAEIITEGVFSSGQFVAQSRIRIARLWAEGWEDKSQSLAHAGQRLARLHPRRRLHDWLQRLDELEAALLRCARQGTRQQLVFLKNVCDRLLRLHPAQVLKQRRELLRQETRQLQEQARHRLRERRERWNSVQARLRLLGPEQVLARGYSITSDAATGGVLRRADAVKRGQRLKTRLSSGEVFSTAEPQPKSSLEE
jgi:exodeoxyribonuclease VII large subunit